MHLISFELNLYYILLFLSIVAISLCASLISCRHDLWKINFKQTFFGMLVFFTLVLILYILFGAARPLVEKNFVQKNQQQIQHAKQLWQQDPEKVIQILEHKSIQNPSDKTAKRLLASLYLRVGKITAAENILHALIQTDQSINLKLLLAEVEYRKHNIELTTKILKEIINNVNADAETLWFAGKLAVTINNKNLAIKAWRLARGQLITMQIDTQLLDQALDRLMR